MCPTPNPDQLQGDIDPGFRRSYHRQFHQTFVPLTITAAGGARQALHSLAAGPITWGSEVATRARHNGGRTTRPGEPDVNIAFTATGLVALRPELGEHVSQHEAFAAGLATRTRQQPLLGLPDTWIVGNPNQQIHAVLNIASQQPLGARVDQLLGSIGAGFTEVDVGGRIEGTALPGGIEHFGFRDGLSQPTATFARSPVAGRLRSWETRGATYVDREDETALYGAPLARAAGPPAVAAPPPPVLAEAPQLPPSLFVVDDHGFWNDGSFMVWLRLRQHVGRFQRACTRIAERLAIEWRRNVSPDDAAALLVGRRRDGTSLALGGLHDVNQFSYRQASRFPPDTVGVRCPLGAHSRKMNPRSIEDSVNLIIRRGIPYGPPDGGDEVDRGLLFVAYQSSIERQFEVLQGAWANSAIVPEPAGSTDALISESSRSGTTFEIPNPSGRGSVGVRISNDWIEPTGGLYLFVPSKAAIDTLAAP